MTERTITVRLEFPPEVMQALSALTAALAARPVASQPPSPAHRAPARTRLAGGLPASDVSSLTLPAAEPASPPVFLGRRKPDRRAVNRWTPERLVIIRRDYPTGRTVAAITNEVNSLPGDKLNCAEIGSYATAAMGLRRPMVFNRNARNDEPVPAPQPEAAQPVIADLPRLPLPVDGKIYATWAQVAAFAQRHGASGFDGDMEPINQFGRRLGLLPIVLTEPFGPGSTASNLASE